MVGVVVGSSAKNANALGSPIGAEKGESARGGRSSRKNNDGTTANCR